MSVCVCWGGGVDVHVFHFSVAYLCLLLSTYDQCTQHMCKYMQNPQTDISSVKDLDTHPHTHTIQISTHAHTHTHTVIQAKSIRPENKHSTLSHPLT